MKSPKIVSVAEETEGNEERRSYTTKVPPQSAQVTVGFYELDRLSDPLIIGFPDLKAWGFYMEPDLDSSGLGWVQFSKFNLKLPLCGSRSANKVNVIHPCLLAGPDFIPVTVRGVRWEMEEEDE